MDLGDILGKIKSNLWLIPEAKFDELTKDAGYMPSFVYLLVCLIISIPFMFITGIVVSGYDGFMAIITAVVFTIFSIPILYISYFISHLFIKLLGGSATLLKTIQIFIYGSTLALILSPVPLLGFIASLIALVNILHGVKRIHNLSLLRVILAIIVIPIAMVVLLALLVFAYLMF